MAQATCPWCGGAVPPASGSRVRIYCSAECKQRSKDARKTERYRTDPEYRAQVRQRQTAHRRRNGAEERVPQVECTLPDCGRPHLARGFCASHYYKDRRRRGLDGGRATPEVIISGLMKGYDQAPQDAVAVSVRGVITVGFMADCPQCGGFMYPVLELMSDDMDVRDCQRCRVLIRLNEEEVSWAISVRHSTEALAAISRSSRNSTTR